MSSYFCVTLSRSIFFVYVLLCTALVMPLFYVLFSVFKLKTLPQYERKLSQILGVYVEWSNRDKITMVQILLTSIFTFSVESANITRPQQPLFPSTICTLPPPSPPIAFPPLLPFQHFSLLKSAKCDEASKQAETWE